MMFGWTVMSVACMKKNGMMVLMKRFQLKKMFWWSFCTLLIHQYIYIGLQLTLQLLSIPTVNTSGPPYTFLKSEFKDTQKQFTENLRTWKHSFMHLPIEICSSTSNSLVIIWNFLKHLTLIHIKAAFFCSLHNYSWFFQWIYIWNNEFNISKIKHHSYEVLNQQVYFIVLVKPVILGDFFEKKMCILLQECDFFLLLPPENDFLQTFWTIAAHSKEEIPRKHW